MIDKKKSFYQVNPRFFKDQNNDGIGDLKGFANKFDYFDFLGVDIIILEDVISADSQNQNQSFIKLDPQVGDINDLKKISSLAKKYNKKLFIELNIGTIKKENNWFASAKTQELEKYQDFVNFVPQKKDDNNYKYSTAAKKYYPIDEKTQEIPLNWQSPNILGEYLEVIKFWIQNGIDGFVLKKFEYLASENKSELMNEMTLKELRKFYRSIKDINKNITIVGKSDLVALADAANYTKDDLQVFDYFLSTKISKIDLHKIFETDAPGFFTSKKLAQAINTYASNSRNILSFNSSLVGKAISRWTNDMQYWKESAKTLGIILSMNKASIGIYQGDEIGAANIGLTYLDDFQTPDIEAKKHFALKQKITEKEFFAAQVSQNAINARSLMAWNEDTNGGFSNVKATITPPSSRFKEINVNNEFLDENSVLYLYREIIKRSTKLTISKILNNGNCKVSSLMPGVIKAHAKNEEKEIIVFANLTKRQKRLPFILPPKGKIIISSYDRKTYKGVPNKLEAYETIVISKQTDEFLRLTRQVMIKEIKEKLSKEQEEIRLKKQQQAEKVRLQKEKEAETLRQRQEKEAKAQRLSEEKEEKLRAAIEQAQAEEKAKLMKAQEKEAEKLQKKKEAEKVKAQALKEKERAEREAEKTKLIELKEKEREAARLAEEKEKAEREAARAAQEQQQVSGFKHMQEAETSENVESQSQDDIHGQQAELSPEPEKTADKKVDKENKQSKFRSKFLFKKTFITEENTVADLNQQEDSHTLNLDDVKEKAKEDRDQERNHLDEATKLKEDEVAKTTLIDDSIDLDELFEFEEDQKNKK